MHDMRSAECLRRLTEDKPVLLMALSEMALVAVVFDGNREFELLV
jgi:hypothetical protein